MTGDAYAKAGVDQGAADSAVAGLVQALGAIQLGRPSRQVPLPGHYASVIRLDERTGIALSTDGVGTKLLVAEELGRFDTIGIDCVAMNVNDVICVGAEPLAMLDYIAIDRADPSVCAEVGVGLARGAELAGVEIPGGELAQLGEMVRGVDVSGACFGTVALDAIVDGSAVQPGDVDHRPPLLRPPLQRLHTGPLGAGGDLPRRGSRRATRPAARRGAARADRDLRQADPRAAALRGRGARPRPHHLGRPRQPAPPGRRCRLRDRRPPRRPADLRADRRSAPATSDDEMHDVFNMGCGFCCIVAAGDEGAALDLLRPHYPGRSGSARRSRGRARSAATEWTLAQAAR